MKEVRSEASRARLQQGKETKGTYRYQEVEAADGDTAVGSLYLQKAAVGDPPPAQLRVTIEANPGKAV